MNTLASHHAIIFMYFLHFFYLCFLIGSACDLKFHYSPTVARYIKEAYSFLLREYFIFIYFLSTYHLMQTIFIYLFLLFLAIIFEF
jgi:hypothetical protein